MHRNESRSHSRSNSRSRSKSRNSRSSNRSRSRSNNSRKKVYRKKEAPQAQSESSQQASLQIENGQSNQESNSMSNDNNEEYSKPKFVDSGKKRTLKEGDYVCLKKQLEAAGTIRRLAKKAALIEFKNGAWGWFGAKKLYPMSEDEFENRKSNFVIDKNLPSPSPSPALTDATDVSHITINDDSTNNGNSNNDSSPYLSVNKNDELTKYINENKNSKGKPVSIYQQMAGNLIALPDEKEKELQSPMSTSSITHNENNNNNNNNDNNDNKEEMRNENDNTRQDSSKNETETETVESEKMKNDISSTLIDDNNNETHEPNDENTNHNDNDDNDNNNTSNSENDNSNTSENDENGATELEKVNKRKSQTKKNKNKKDKKEKKDEKVATIGKTKQQGGGKSSLESSEELAKKRNSKSLMENRLKIDESERMRREFERKLKLHYKVTDERERTFLVIADESRLIYESTFLKYFKAIVFLNNSDKISQLFDNKKYKTAEKENSAKDDSIIKFFNYISENTNPLTFSKFVKCIDDDGDIVDAYIRWFNTGKSRASRGKGHLQTQTSIQK